ncbi:4a-hydroxytetrahydrobiopterin dehydratase [Porticoccus sp. W117]|uniref:4a-hydroxytetrahydrobiopterin dehydratase n=1 Tax=Porticoccus sp. W117 TaxID=3054777 RepID=UPI00259ACEA1|nr:4a-hydroxytetrahydrobiopterin dehydratase [Porticoccus sp. W117]MDM3871694.1 4a-hydroxytetrahydrobiopterin dehydratase [Porticoccus sp. W117]
MSLAQETCEACRPGSPQVSDSESATLLTQLPDWQIVDINGIKQLQRTFTFSNFRDAMNFANQIGEVAESVNHHPVLLVEWGKVTVSWWTHTIRGLHRNDFILAARTDELALP